ncbi:MAG: hypothetical protein HY518_05235 [Candidatus Aenigmarchaeota archaeon]|nr:hypothetical protein [Candidatus Aenigmarchaeota archaeon]
MDDNAPSKMVLVADDDDVYRGIIVAGLSRLYTTVEARCGYDAQRIIQHDRIDFALLDNDMPPGPKGSDIAIGTKRSRPDFPLAIYTGVPLTASDASRQGIKVFNKSDLDIVEQVVEYARDTIGE